MKNDLSQTISENLYEWFIAQPVENESPSYG